MAVWRRALQPLVYAWAFPTTAVGLVAGALTLATGGTSRFVGGRWSSTEGFRGGFWSDGWSHASAMTLGHAIIGRDDHCLTSCRDHEQAHVRQVERWGIAFIPAYLFASGWAWSQGRHYYLDNWFEVDARRTCGEDFF